VGEGDAAFSGRGHEEAWWALEVDAGPYGPHREGRSVVATTDPKELPDKATWYLRTNLPHPGSERSREEGALAPADLSEVVRLYGLSTATSRSSMCWAGATIRSGATWR
jgi:hypothetical protein